MYPSCKQVFPCTEKAFEVPLDLKKRKKERKKERKKLMYKVLNRPALTHASKTWTLSKTNERQLSLFERKVLRCILGAKQENETWQKRHNYELYEAFNEPNIVNPLTSNGH